MKHFLILLILATIGLQSCKVGTSGTWMDDNIDQRLKRDIEVLNNKVIDAVTSNNPSLLKSVMSDKLLEKGGENIEQLTEQIGSIIRSKEFRVLNQFHVKNTTTGVGNTVLSGISGLNDYVIHYKALNKEMFISLIISGNGLDEFVITNIYGKYPDGWKLNILQFGQYKINGQTATELYLKAKSDYDKGYLFDAANTMFLSSRVAKPAGEYWKYQKEKEVTELYEAVLAEANTKYKFPYLIDNIDTEPEIMNIYPVGMVEGYFPMVEYLTKISLTDTLKTKLENDKIHQSIGDLFYGLDKDKKFVFYKAYNKVPNGKTPVPTYGFVKEIE